MNPIIGLSTYGCD